jgi:hypothetical protein
MQNAKQKCILCMVGVCNAVATMGQRHVWLATCQYMQSVTVPSLLFIPAGGEWISSIEIENMAMSVPGVAEAAVIGIPDEKWGERPLLVVVPKTPPGEPRTAMCDRSSHCCDSVLRRSKTRPLWSGPASVAQFHKGGE